MRFNQLQTNHPHLRKALLASNMTMFIKHDNVHRTEHFVLVPDLMRLLKIPLNFHVNSLPLQ